MTFSIRSRAEALKACNSIIIECNILNQYGSEIFNSAEPSKLIKEKGELLDFLGTLKNSIETLTSIVNNMEIPAETEATLADQENVEEVQSL